MAMEKLFDGEFRFMQIIWENAPINSGELVRLCEQEFEWKKSTTYTMIKKMCEKGYIATNDAVITVLIPMEQAQKAASEDFVDRTFGGSFQGLMAAFFGGKKISAKEAEELKKMIDEHKAE